MVSAFYYKQLDKAPLTETEGEEGLNPPPALCPLLLSIYPIPVDVIRSFVVNVKSDYMIGRSICQVT